MLTDDGALIWPEPMHDRQWALQTGMRVVADMWVALSLAAGGCAVAALSGAEHEAEFYADAAG